jgi:hypothetical protein|nr:MAG TPA_asm: hypothetical protein [Caudoviricetes sp.]
MSRNERREVAERLRKHAGWLVLLGEPIGEDELDGNCENTGIGADYLADLIDPTCHLWPSHDGGFGCDRCFTWFPEMKAKTSYCPACGARVVDYAEGDDE